MKPRVPKKLRDDVLERDEFTCMRCGTAVTPPFYSLQHRRPAGMGGSKLVHTMANLVTLCGSGTTLCHGEVESDRITARAEGWLVPNGVTPEEWRVWRWTPDGHRWEQPGVTWVPASPHPRQTEEAA